MKERVVSRLYQVFHSAIDASLFLFSDALLFILNNPQVPEANACPFITCTKAIIIDFRHKRNSFKLVN